MNIHEPSQPVTGEKRTGTRWMRYVVLLAIVVGAGWYVFGQRSDVESESELASTPATFDDKQSTTATLDEALAIARSAMDSMESTLVDYEAKLIKREEVDGELVPENELTVKIRTHRDGAPDQGIEPQPLSVYVRFHRPDSAKGREVIYREGWNDGKLMVHETGLMNIMRLSLDPNGMLAMKGNRYPITKVGFKTLVRELIVRGEQIQRIGSADVKLIPDYDIGGRKCLLIQVRPKFDSLEGVPEDIRFSLAEIAMDQEWQVPLHYAAYGFPTNPQDPPPLQERYTYREVRLNPGLVDQDFDPDNPAYEFP